MKRLITDVRLELVSSREALVFSREQMEEKESIFGINKAVVTWEVSHLHNNDSCTIRHKLSLGRETSRSGYEEDLWPLIEIILKELGAAEFKMDRKVLKKQQHNLWRNLIGYETRLYNGVIIQGIGINTRELVIKGDVVAQQILTKNFSLTKLTNAKGPEGISYKKMIKCHNIAVTKTLAQWKKHPLQIKLFGNFIGKNPNSHS